MRKVFLLLLKRTIEFFRVLINYGVFLNQRVIFLEKFNLLYITISYQGVYRSVLH